jgi:Na+-driven multidrug efflux pump
MGEKRPVTARRSSDTAQLFAFVVTGGTAVLLQVFRRSLASLFSQDPEVIAKVDQTVSSCPFHALRVSETLTYRQFIPQAWLLAIVALFDGVQGESTM